jgi:hypothetical protein
MAKKITEIMIDDISGEELTSETGETVKFSLDGINFEIDLSHANAREMREALQGYISKSRRNSTNSGAPRRTSSGVNDPRELGEARTWLRGKGYTVSDRGRIPATLLAEFRSAQ